MDTSPLILVTGAAGRIGSHTADLLHEKGFRLRATDIAEKREATYEFRQANLLNFEEANDLLQAVDIVVHLGNHPGLRHPQTTFNENVAVNMNIFQGAAEADVKKIIFASTLQLIGSHVDRRTVINLPGALEYPINGSTPALPANTYALSKTVSERMLQYFVERCGIDAVAIRFPLVVFPERMPNCSPESVDDTIAREGFSWLPADDASRLILAAIETRLPGYRVYAPGMSTRVSASPLSELIRKHLPHVPDSLDNLIDNSVITQETGWEPMPAPESKGASSPHFSRRCPSPSAE